MLIHRFQDTKRWESSSWLFSLRHGHVLNLSCTSMHCSRIILAVPKRLDIPQGISKQRTTAPPSRITGLRSQCFDSSCSFTTPMRGQKIPRASVCKRYSTHRYMTLPMLMSRIHPADHAMQRAQFSIHSQEQFIRSYVTHRTPSLSGKSS